MSLNSTNAPLAVVVLALMAVVAGLCGRRWLSVGLLTHTLAPISSAIPLLYFLFQATVPVCTADGRSATCVQVPYPETWSLVGWLLMGSAMLLSSAPLASIWFRTLLPSAIAALALLVLVALFTIFLWSWLLALSLVFAASIAGPPDIKRLFGGGSPAVEGLRDRST
jgi:hypothetical protein